MVTLLKKEIAGFFSSLTGYLVVIVFLTATGIFMWIVPGETNILDSGYANMETFFALAPWVFLFLIPAITMRLFSDELRTGTIELLLTKPISETKIVLAKYFAALTIAIISIIPTFVYFFSVYKLGSPVGNIDIGGTWGSYIGLFFLAAVYVAIGVFTSSLTSNQIVSFILAVVLSFVFYYGFDALSLIFNNTKAEYYLQGLSINRHYLSISRGVVDTRDIVYFISVTSIFIMITGIRRSNKVQLSITVAIIVLLTIISNFIFTRIDLTEDKRFTLSGYTKQMLSELDDIVYFKVYLDGDLPAGFKRLEKSTRELLNEFSAYGKDNIQFEFIDPSESSDKKTRNDVFRQLYRKGLNPTNLQVKNSDGSTSQKVIFPGIMVSYRGREIPVNILKKYTGYSAEGNLNASVQGLEYELTYAMYKLTAKKSPRIAFIAGHGELDSMQVNDIVVSLSDFYRVDRVRLNGNLYSLRDTLNRNKYKLIIVAKPAEKFSEKDKFLIDQFVMHGGRVLWLIDQVNADIDSLAYSRSIMGLANDFNLNDILFRYGVRINPDLIQDMQCNVIPVNTALVGQKPKFEPAPWIYFPLLSPNQKNHITRNLDMIKTQFVSSIDTVGGNTAIEKTVLLTSSKYSRTVTAPVLIDLSMISERLDPRRFNKPFLTTAVLLEGEFSSIFAHRLPPVLTKNKDIDFKDKSKQTKMIVISDGDIIRNLVRGVGKGARSMPLGYDRYTKQTFGNKEFIVNSINYLCGMDGLLESRAKEIKLRLLDRPKITEQRLLWQVVNVLIPLLVVVLAGWLYTFYRKKSYGKNS